jgi:hypothetical protein
VLGKASYLQSKCSSDMNIERSHHHARCVKSFEKSNLRILRETENAFQKKVKFQRGLVLGKASYLQSKCSSDMNIERSHHHARCVKSFAKSRV